jgi:hypothetical protein
MFPGFEEKIDSLFQKDENFQDLCKDYLLCISIASEMKKNTNKNRAQLEEYENLKESLQQEIKQMITV